MTQSISPSCFIYAEQTVMSSGLTQRSLLTEIAATLALPLTLSSLSCTGVATVPGSQARSSNGQQLRRFSETSLKYVVYSYACKWSISECLFFELEAWALEISNPCLQTYLGPFSVSYLSEDSTAVIRKLKSSSGIV
jgi:hypothetical protein